MYPGLVTKAITFFRRLGEFARLSVIFPENAVGFWARYVGEKVKSGGGAVFINVYKKSSFFFFTPEKKKKKKSGGL